ncbi:MAG: hypothetical protein JJE25_10295 [Bacteroidia bacterium]|nr:hypothetical protein [Bacteroidia bacterium]
MSSIRQLAAIMFTDIVGYTSLMGHDREKAFAVLKKSRKIQKPIIEEHNGKWIKEIGDGVLTSFNPVSDAVQAAIQIQVRINTGKYFQLRIGIHLGEVVFENGDVFGDGVNVASRIQSAAKPGSIFISGKVFDDIKNQKDIKTFLVGRYFLKNVKDEVELFAISNQGIEIPDAGFLNNVKQTTKKCILVLPFVNMSNDKEQDYFSDGLTEELIAGLSRLNDIKVISWTTSMQYKNTRKELKKVAIETGADYIMEGSVRKFGSHLRITAQFIDAAKDIHLWSENYNGTIKDIFLMQEKVSTKIVEALWLQLSNDERKTLQKRYTNNTEAYQLYLKGRYFWKKRNEKGLKTAITFFEKAIAIDADYALAWAGLADTYSLMGEFTNISRRILLPKVMTSVNKALQLDNRLAEAHISLAVSLMLNEWKWKNAEKEFRIGIELNPNYATGHHWFAELLLYTGNASEAFREISLAVDLDPISKGILKDKGIFYYYHRQYDEAIEMAEKTLELDSDFIPAHRLLSLIYCAKGMYKESINANKQWGKLTRNKVKTDVALAQIYGVAGRKKDAEKIIAAVGSGKSLSGNDYRGMALVFTALGNKDKAFEWLEKSYRRNEESLCSLKVDPKFDPIRSDPRFTELLKKVGLQ